MNGDEFFGGVAEAPWTQEVLADPTFMGDPEGGLSPADTMLDPGAGNDWPTMRDFTQKASGMERGWPQGGGGGPMTPLTRTAAPRMFQPNQPMLPPGVSSSVSLARTEQAILAFASTRIGSRLTLLNAVSLISKLGAAAAAVALGLTIAEIYTLLTAHVMKRGRRGRRGRGITGRQISNARRTIRRMTTFMGMVQGACAPVAARGVRRRHRAGCGCAVCRRAA